MRYLLDTNVCIEVLHGRNPALKARLATRSFDELALCSIVWAELHCGARLAQNSERELERLKDAFGHWTRWSFDDAAAERYGEIRAHLQRAGNLIAAIAQAQSLTLITHNTAEFTRVPGLSVEDWQV